MMADKSCQMCRINK